MLIASEEDTLTVFPIEVWEPSKRKLRRKLAFPPRLGRMFSWDIPGTEKVQ